MTQMAPVLDGIRGKQLPEAILVCNFPKPTATDPGLMDYGDVVTFFHEFGHLMHHILGGQQQWAGISGISMEADFAEAPSQMLEEWMRSPQVLASFAHHYKTGEPIPADLVARMNRASAFGRANGVARRTRLSAISYDLYKDTPQQHRSGCSSSCGFSAVHLVCSRCLRRSLVCVVQPPGRLLFRLLHLHVGQGHCGGFLSAVRPQNLLAGDAPMRYRRLVLEPGGSMSANDLVSNFLGRPQNMAAFQRWMGEEFEGQFQSDKTKAM